MYLFCPRTVVQLASQARTLQEEAAVAKELELFERAPLHGSHFMSLSQGCYQGLVSVIVSSWGNETSVYRLVANNIHLGS